jgi:hypothetical protein
MPSTILSDNGVTSGSAGLKTTAASDGALALQTTTAGGVATTALTINTSQNVTLAGTLTTTGTTTFNGNQIISVTDNTNAALRITQLGTGNALLVEDSSNPDASPFVIDSAGVLIRGATSSQTIFGSSVRNQFLGTGNEASNAIVGYANSATGGGNGLILGRSRGATVGADVILQSGDLINRISFVGSDGTALIESAHIESRVDGTPGTSDMPGRLVFSTTADGASTPTEAMRINSAQNVSIGASSAAVGTTLRLSKSITGAVASYVILNNGTIQSDVTTSANIFTSNVSTVASAFTLATLRHFYVNQGTVGATSAITNQYGFFAESGMTGATNNYGFYGDIASGTGRYNFYANGTAANYFAGTVQTGSTIGVGGATPSGSGSGITFPATQSASSDANTLDDYEEGTWSPAVGGTATYSGQDGRYTKVGRLVTCHFDITINLIGTGNTSQITNFPFTNSGTITTGSVSFYAGIATAINFISFYLSGSATNCIFVGNSGNTTTITNAVSVFTNSTRVIGSITYSTS